MLNYNLRSFLSLLLDAVELAQNCSKTQPKTIQSMYHNQEIDKINP